jgi:hypothetical protein
MRLNCFLKKNKQTHLDDFKGKRDVYGLCDRLGNVKEPLHVFIVNTRCNRLFFFFFYFQRQSSTFIIAKKVVNWKYIFKLIKRNSQVVSQMLTYMSRVNRSTLAYKGFRLEQVNYLKISLQILFIFLFRIRLNYMLVNDRRVKKKKRSTRLPRNFITVKQLLFH